MAVPAHTDIFCPKPVRGRVVRMARLDGCGIPDAGADNMVVTAKAFTAMTFTPAIDAGEALGPIRVMDGTTCIYDRGLPQYLGFDVEVKLCGMVWPILELTLGSRALMSAPGAIINGGTIPQIEAGRAVSVEIWSDNHDADSCVDNACPYIQWGFPKLINWQLSGPLPFSTGVTEVTLSAFLVQNAAWGDGPVGAEWTGHTLDDDFMGWFCTDELPETTECEYAGAVS